MTSRISAVFEQLAAAGKMAFMPFIVAGDPNLSSFAPVVHTLADAGVDMIEVGIPYSDPIADGPVIQAAYQRALDAGTTLRQIFDSVKQTTASRPAGTLPPLVAMVSYAIIFRAGLESFCRQASDSGFSGLIVPDLPADEAADLAPIVHASGLDLVELIAPTTTADRTSRILNTATGFLYCISVAGTTGVRQELPSELLVQLKSLRTQTKLPLAVGFGISKPDQVDSLRGLAQGVIVGSAIVKQIAAAAESSPGKTLTVEQLSAVKQFAAEMSAATHRNK